MAEPLSPDDLAALPTAREDEQPWGRSSDTVLAEDLATQATNRAVAQTRYAGEPEPGDAIGRFQVREVLGRGGMGVVVSAHDPRLQRQVAIKLVKPMAGVGTDSDAKVRILREARAMARFRHPNIVSVFEVGEHDGGVYVAMEQVERGTLREALQRMEAEGSADWRLILGMFAKAGRGLAAAHATGMVHRDFKPDNVLIDSHDRVLVSDFGIVMDAATRDTSARSDMFGRRIIPMAVGYLLAFLVSAAHPQLFFPILVTAHCLGAATAVVIFGTPPVATP